jgi:hemolysin III
VKRLASPAGAPLLLIPRLRGVLHHYSFFVAVGLGLSLVLFASSLRARIAMAIYACGLAGCLGVSALYHRGRWSTPVKARLGRLDHSMIFLLIAGTYTPFCLLALGGAVATWMLIAIWGGAAAGIALTLLWWRAPTLVEVTPYVLLGWAAAFAIPQFISVLGWTAFGLLIGGGALYSVGAVVYTTEWPNPRPSTFGFHEIFHCFVVAAAGIHLATIMVFLLPRP